MKIRCIDCEYFSINAKKLDEGQCRRYTPKVFPMMTEKGMQFITCFPQVTRDAGCGEGTVKMETTN